jgi:hypothetical protein
MIFLVVSLMVNIVVFGLLPVALLGQGITMLNTYGPDTAARRTLACVYGSIALVSFAALFSTALTSETTLLKHIATVLLPFQILFICLSRWSLGSGNPVANANLAIAALHTIALLVYWWPQVSGASL